VNVGLSAPHASHPRRVQDGGGKGEGACGSLCDCVCVCVLFHVSRFHTQARTLELRLRLQVRCAAVFPRVHVCACCLLTESHLSTLLSSLEACVWWGGHRRGVEDGGDLVSCFDSRSWRLHL